MSDGRPAANDQDRLPWLEPYREPPTRRARPAKAAVPARSGGARSGLLAVAAVIGISAALAGGYWMGQREGSPVATTPTAAPTQVALNAPVVQPPTPAVEAAPPETTAASTQPRRVVAKASHKRSAPRRPKIHSAGVETAQIDKVKEEQGEPVAPRVWPKMPSPGPAGQVIQLGAFSHPDVAYAAYKRRIARYPGLGRMPRVIVPVVQPKGEFLYVLRLGTGSRSQAKIVCRNLKRSGDPCVVIG